MYRERKTSSNEEGGHDEWIGASKSQDDKKEDGKGDAWSLKYNVRVSENGVGMKKKSGGLVLMVVRSVARVSCLELPQARSQVICGKCLHFPASFLPGMSAAQPS